MPPPRSLTSLGIMPRISLRISKRMLGRIDGLVEEGKFPSRSEAVREAIIKLLARYDTERLSEDDDRP